jgi:hypothetical protein
MLNPFNPWPIHCGYIAVNGIGPYCVYSWMVWLGALVLLALLLAMLDR